MRDIILHYLCDKSKNPKFPIESSYMSKLMDKDELIRTILRKIKQLKYLYVDEKGAIEFDSLHKFQSEIKRKLNEVEQSKPKNFGRLLQDC